MRGQVNERQAVSREARKVIRTGIETKLLKTQEDTFTNKGRENFTGQQGTLRRLHFKNWH